MKIGIPVVCQNGHTSTWVIELVGMDAVDRGATDACHCPKWNLGEGWRPTGDAAFVILPKGARTAFADLGLVDDVPDVEIGSAVDHCIRVDQLTRDLMAAEIEAGMAGGLNADEAFTGVSGGVMGALLALAWRNRGPGATPDQLVDHMAAGMRGVLQVIAAEEEAA